MTRTISWRTAEPNLEQRVDGDGIHVAGGCVGPFNWGCSIDYDVAVPDGFDLDLDSSSGSVTVRDVAFGRLRQQVSSGDVELSGVTGAIEVRSSSGTVRADRLTSDDVYVEASSGDVGLDFATSPRSVVADVSSGDVRIALPAGKYAVTADTSSGNRRVDVPVDTTSDRTVTVTTSSGDVDVTANGR